MRPNSARLWQDFIANYDRVHVYTIHPGAHAIARELVPLLRSMGRLGTWYAAAWSAAQQEGTTSADEMAHVLQPGDALVVGQSTVFADTQAVLKQAAAAGATSIFVFDHWKNYAAHFGDGPLPDVIVVPDAIAAASIVDLFGNETRSRIRVLPHLAIEAAADRILTSGIVEETGMVALLLDPTEAADGLGYDWRSVLAAVLRKKHSASVRRVLVKPHPRQDVGVVARELSLIHPDHLEAEMFSGDTEHLIARASEVWGMTTIALNIALAANKPIRSFQFGRNEVGLRASNPHLEPYVIR
jgi:hypothetical protein